MNDNQITDTMTQVDAMLLAVEVQRVWEAMDGPDRKHERRDGTWLDVEVGFLRSQLDIPPVPGEADGLATVRDAAQWIKDHAPYMMVAKGVTSAIVRSSTFGTGEGAVFRVEVMFSGGWHRYVTALDAEQARWWADDGDTSGVDIDIHVDKVGTEEGRCAGAEPEDIREWGR